MATVRHVRSRRRLAASASVAACSSVALAQRLLAVSAGCMPLDVCQLGATSRLSELCRNLWNPNGTAALRLKCRASWTMRRYNPALLSGAPPCASSSSLLRCDLSRGPCWPLAPRPLVKRRINHGCTSPLLGHPARLQHWPADRSARDPCERGGRAGCSCSAGRTPPRHPRAPEQAAPPPSDCQCGCCRGCRRRPVAAGHGRAGAAADAGRQPSRGSGPGSAGAGRPCRRHGAGPSVPALGGRARRTRRQLGQH